MKKLLAVCFLLFMVTSFSFGQIYRCEADGKTGPMIIALHFVDYGNYQYVFYTEDCVVFMDEDNVNQLREILGKYLAWKTQAKDGQITITKTIDFISFSSYYQNRAFFRTPAIFYFVFTGGPLESASATPETKYTLFVDTNLEKIQPFRLSSEQVQELVNALLPENLSEARSAYMERRALEELFF